MDISKAKDDAKGSNDLFMSVALILGSKDLEDLGEAKKVVLDVWVDKHWLYNFMLDVIDRRRRELKSGNHSTQSVNREFFEKLIEEADWDRLINGPSDEEPEPEEEDVNWWDRANEAGQVQVNVRTRSGQFTGMVQMPENCPGNELNYGQGVTHDKEDNSICWQSLNDLCDCDEQTPVSILSIDEDDRIAVDLHTDHVDRRNGWDKKDRSMKYTNLLELKWHARQLSEAVKLAEALHTCRDQINMNCIKHDKDSFVPKIKTGTEKVPF